MSTSQEILLVNPWIHDFAAYDLWSKPLGLLYLGALLERAGYKVRLLDCLDRWHPDLLRLQGRDRPKIRKFGCGRLHMEEIPKPSVFKEVERKFKRHGVPPDIVRADLAERPRPSLVLVTCLMTYWYPGAAEAIHLVKEAFPGVPVALGGVYPTLCYDHAVAHSGADQVVRGPGEQAVLELAEQHCGPPPRGAPLFETLDDLPWPAYHLMSRLDSVSMLTSRGCPFQCTYCASQLLRPEFEQRDPQAVASEMEFYVRRLRQRNIAFYDDALLVDPETHLIRALDLFEENGMHCQFHTPNGLHVRYIDDVLAQRLYKSHFRTLRLSFETTDLARQRDSSGKVSNPELKRSIQGLRKAGYTPKEIEVYVMVGLPGQTTEEVIETLCYVHECGGRIKIADFSPIPGTAELERADSELQAQMAEPLSHNNSARAARWQPVKSLTGLLNMALDHGLGLYDSTPVAASLRKALAREPEEA